MNAHCVTAGVDIGGTNTVVGIIDDSGACLQNSRFPTTGQKSAEEFVQRLATTIRELCRDLPGENELRGIGIAAPAADYRLGTIQNPANLQWKTVEIAEMMKQHFDVPVAVTNDANAAALGEIEHGSAKGMKNFIVITLGTGLGAGIVVDGRLLDGESGAAGELGHLILDTQGRECGCGRRGCVETYVSATGIRRTAFELLARRTTKSLLRSMTFEEVTSKKLFELAQGGDAIACEAFDVTGAHLGRMLTNIVAVFDPQAVILSGGLANAGDLLLEPTRRVFENNVLGIYKGRVKIFSSGLPDGRAAVLGASWLVRSSFQENVVT